MSQVVRVAAETDLSGLLALYRYLHPDDPALPDATATAVWRDLLSLTNTRIFVIDGADALAASCVVTIIPNLAHGGRPYAVIENVVTHPLYRRKGFGRAVMTAAIQAAWAANSYKIFLTTGSTEDGTLRFYESLGFRRNSRTLFDLRRD